MKERDIFLAALRRGKTPRPAVGSATSVATTDLMEKAEAFFPEAHLDPEAMARLAAAGHTAIGFDNVMPLFGVWHESAALGCPVDWGERNRMPDCRAPLCADIGETVKVPADLVRRAPCAVPLKALALLKKRHGDEIAVIGKVFGPWTLGYHVYGVEDFLVASLLQPDAVKRALRALIEVTVSFAKAQIDAGADALCLGDHCTRDLCSPEAYREFLKEIHHELHERIPCPLILHICGDTSDRIPFIRETGVECFHFDSKTGTASARELAGETLALMGGTSNFQVVRSGTPEQVRADVEEKVKHRIDILGPECAVPLDASWKNLKLIADTVKGRRRP